MESIKQFRSSIKVTRSIFLIFIIQLIISGPAFAEKQEDGISNAMVQIYTVNSEPSYSKPWMMQPPGIINGSGFIIDGNRVLTNAHIVANQKTILVKRYGKSTRYRAAVLNVSHKSDLALLSIDDKEFFSGVVPLKLGELPEVEQEVLIYGFPAGKELVITEGMLFRFARLEYRHSSSYLLTGEITASIKTGNSGGPVIVNNKVSGIVMQASGSKNIAHMIPSPVIEHFLKDIADGRYDGFPDAGLITQNITTPFLKKRHNLQNDRTGVLINQVLPGSEAKDILQKDDIILAINGHNISDDGNIEFRPGEWISYNYLIEMQQIGEKISLDIMRSGKNKNITLSLNKTREDFLLIPNEQYDRRPKYFIFGGIVFSTLTKNFLNTCDETPKGLAGELLNWPTREMKEVVIALKVLPADINKGYHDMKSWVVSKVNGNKIKDLNELHSLVTTASDPLIVFENKYGNQIVIDREKAEKTHKSILSTYYIKKDCSTELANLHAGNHKLPAIKH
jgi:S1-C subfamily serine protease